MVTSAWRFTRFPSAWCSSRQERLAGLSHEALGSFSGSHRDEQCWRADAHHKTGGLDPFRNATPRNPDAKARLDIWNAEVSTRLVNQQTPELRAFVAKNRNLIVTEYQATGGEAFDIELARHKDTTGVIPTSPEFGAEGRDVWVRISSRLTQTPIRADSNT